MLKFSYKENFMRISVIFFMLFPFITLKADPQYIFSPPDSSLLYAVLRSNAAGGASSMWNWNNKVYYTYTAGSSFTAPIPITTTSTNVYNARVDAFNNMLSFYSFDNKLYYSYGPIDQAFKTINTYTLSSVNVIYSSLVQYATTANIFILILDTDQGLFYVEFNPSIPSFQNPTLISQQTQQVSYRSFAISPDGDVCVVWIDADFEGCADYSTFYWSYKTPPSVSFTSAKTITGTDLKTPFDVNYFGQDPTTYFMITYRDDTTFKGFLVSNTGTAGSTKDINYMGDTYALDSTHAMIVSGPTAYLFDPNDLNSSSITYTEKTISNDNIYRTKTITVNGAAYVSYKNGTQNNFQYSYLENNSSEFLLKGTYKFGDTPSLLAEKTTGESYLLWENGTSKFIYSNYPTSVRYWGLSQFIPVFYKNTFYP